MIAKIVAATPLLYPRASTLQPAAAKTTASSPLIHRDRTTNHILAVINNADVHSKGRRSLPPKRRVCAFAATRAIWASAATTKQIDMLLLTRSFVCIPKPCSWEYKCRYNSYLESLPLTSNAFQHV